MVKYRVSELAKLLNVSDVAIRKRIKRGEFDVVQELYDKRMMTFICLNEKQIKDLGINKKTKKENNTQPAINPTNNNEIKELISTCIEKYEKFYKEYATRIDELNQQNTLLTAENTKLKAQLSSVITKYNTLAKRVNASISKKSAD